MNIDAQEQQLALCNPLRLAVRVMLIMLPIASSAMFLSLRLSLVAIGFGSSSQLLSRGFSSRHDGGEGGRWKEGERSGRASIADQTAGMTERASTPLSILSVGAQNSVKKGVHFGTH
jgi:hypothetical protein